MSIVNQVKPLCNLADITDINLIPNKDVFVVRDANGVAKSAVYANDGFNNSDRTRAHFAKTNGIKFTDTRCSRLKNAR